jgi:hypothetical protein
MNSFAASLFDAAKSYQDLGIPLVPVGHKDRKGPGGLPGKVAMIPWRKEHPDPAHVLDVIARDPRVSGIAAILGPESNLICRDWDKPGSFAAWRDENPMVARSLPMVRSARGSHLYTVATDVWTKKLADGELRGAGSYILLPPSHTLDPPAGAPKQYEWMTRLPRSLDLIQRVDPAVLIGHKISHGQPTGMPRERHRPGPQNPLIHHAYGALGGISISECIRESLPSGPGQRNDCIFGLARRLRSVLPADTSEGTLCGIAAEWFALAYDVIRTKDFRDTQRGLLDAWRKVELPVGCIWDSIVRASRNDSWKPRLGTGSADRIAKLLRAAGRAHGGQAFVLDYERMADAVGVNKMSARDAAKKVLAAGWAVIVEPGISGRGQRTGIATIWRWTGPA